MLAKSFGTATCRPTIWFSRGEHLFLGVKKCCIRSCIILGDDDCKRIGICFNSFDASYILVGANLVKNKLIMKKATFVRSKKFAVPLCSMFYLTLGVLPTGSIASKNPFVSFSKTKERLCRDDQTNNNKSNQYKP